MSPAGACPGRGRNARRFTPSRTCPQCRSNVCPGHSRQLTTMGGQNSLGHYRCGVCGYVGPLEDFLRLPTASG